MNYIQRITDENKILAEKLSSIDLEILAIRKYLNSPKFHHGSDLDNYVNTNDIHARLDNLTAIIAN